MKVLLINSVCGIRSTGRICTDIAKDYMADGHECIIAYGREYVPEAYSSISYRIGSDLSVILNGIKTRFFDNEGFNAKYSTIKFIRWAENYDPDMVWIHNLHGYYINIKILFDWIKSRPQMKVRWTLHDCWAFTGHCPHFSYVNCEQWKRKCIKCIQKKKYPISILLDRCKQNFEKKKKVFCNVRDLTIQVPSNWMSEFVVQSFLKEYPVEVVYNKIDLNIFKPTEGDFREKYNLQNMKIVLGVASAWGKRKGLYDFFELSQRLDENYKVVLVGVTKKQMKKAPSNIICIERTDSMEELAEIYSSVDVFLNPSREESFGLTTLEALSCGTDAIVYKGTACEEIANKYGGIVVIPDINTVVDAIKQVCEGEK